MHSHPHEQLTYVLSGEFEFTIGEEKHIVRAGDTLYKAPHVMHGCVCLQPGTLLDTFTPYGKIFAIKRALISAPFFCVGYSATGSGSGLRLSIASRSSTLPQANSPPGIPASMTISAFPGHLFHRHGRRKLIFEGFQFNVFNGEFFSCAR